MFKNLFDLSYERNSDEAIVFYFFYVIVAYYISMSLYFLASRYPNIDFISLSPIIPFFLSGGLSIGFMLKKFKNPFKYFFSYTLHVF